MTSASITCVNHPRHRQLPIFFKFFLTAEFEHWTIQGRWIG